MCNMQFFVVCFVLVAVSIDSTKAFGLGIFEGLFEPSSGCTVLVEVPLIQFDPYYKAEWFDSLNSKLNANQDRFNRDLHQVWVDAPDPSICGFRPGGRCVLNGHFGSEYKWLVFKSGDKKKIANEQLWAESRERQLPYYKVYADAPERYCKRQFNGLADFWG